MSTVTPNNPDTPSGNPLIDGLLQGYSWTGAPLNFTYTFFSAPTTTAQWTAQQMADVAQVFTAWSDVANVTFSSFTPTPDLVPSDNYKMSAADIAVTLFGPPDSPGALAFSTFPDSNLTDQQLAANGDTRTNYPNPEGDVFLFNTQPEFTEANMAPGGYGFLAVMHEIGHSLGLKHPFDDGGNGQPLLDPTFDNGYQTIMSYQTPQDVDYGKVLDESKGFQDTPMPFDIRAIQYLYGANLATGAGDTVYDLSTFLGRVHTIWDGSGIDTLDAHKLANGISMSLEDGSFTHLGDGFSTVAIAYAGTDPADTQLAIIENALGTNFNDTIVGNLLDNTLDGGAGNDTLEGHTGADTLMGGLGNDTYVIDDGNETIVELAGAGSGTDTVKSGEVGFDLTNFANVENLTLTSSALSGDLAINGTGNTGDNVIIGNTATNTLDGGAGNDTLDGGGGVDTLIGGLGNDIFIVHNATDVVTENALEGTDLVKSFAATYTLSSDVENLTLTGPAALAGTGNLGDNIITGNALGNTLDGGGGGIDTLIGGAGNDTYIVQSLTDVINDSSGTDTVSEGAFANYTLAAGLENLILTGVGDINGTGNSLNNVLTGNSGNNILDGGAGTDTMVGGAGNDTYHADINDTIVENPGDTADTVVFTGFKYTLGANLEDLIMGSGMYQGTGNSLSNTITGNNGANVIDGGTGADSMIGGGGNDVYVVDNIGDVVDETTGFAKDADVIQSSVNYTLPTGVETLVLTAPGLIGTGNAGANTLFGGGGADTLDGGGGADIMKGGNGNDVYFVDNIGDSISDSSGTDTVISSVNYTLGLTTENLKLATGIANINGTGNDIGNTLTGNDGDNILNGAAGADTMSGGKGNDSYIVDNAHDVIIENVGEGTDIVFASVSYTLSDLSEIENLTLTGVAISGTGNILDNIITGNNSNNLLDGGGDVLGDTLSGGLGNDTYVVHSALTVVQEGVNGGVDTIRTSISWDMSATPGAHDNANVENLVLASGAGNINGTGNLLNNNLTGNEGDNVLDGGAGADKMSGGLGNDTYFADNAGDVILENTGGGTDSAFSSVSYTLGINVENLTLSGAALRGTGNASNNIITGDAAANTLSGLGGNDTLDGGAGADTLTGGIGADHFVIKAADVGSGIDAITDFSHAPGGDVIDISDVLATSGYVAGVSVVTNFVEILTVGTHSALFVDTTGSASFTTQLATINGVGLTDEAALVTTLHLIL